MILSDNTAETIRRNEKEQKICVIFNILACLVDVAMFVVFIILWDGCWFDIPMMILMVVADVVLVINVFKRERLLRDKIDNTLLSERYR